MPNFDLKNMISTLHKGFFMENLTQICSIELKEEKFKSSYFYGKLQ
jgi:hypothetical protein